MKPVFKYILLTLGVLCILAYLIMAVWIFSGLRYKEVCHKFEIKFYNNNSPVQLITEEDIAKLIDQKGLTPYGKTLKNIYTDSIENVLRKNPMIKQVECFKTPDGSVYLLVEQRKPKFRLIGYESFYVDEDRNIIPTSVSDAAYLPVVSGRVKKSMAKGELFDFITFLEKDTFWNAQIEQIYVTNDGKIKLVPRVGTGIIVLGDLDDYENKLQKLKKLYVDGFNKIGWNHYKIINLQYKNQIVCTRENQSDKLSLDFSEAIE